MTIPQNMALFQAIGTAFGGNPDAFFKLPDLGQRAAVGAGGSVALGEDVPAGSNGVPGLGINYLINIGGTPAPEGGAGGFPATGEALGEVIAYAGPGIPPGWAPCDGSLFTIAGNEALFGLIGTAYGGDGKTSFALPDLQGKMLTGPPRAGGLTVEAQEGGGGTGWQNG
jgi:microcystin-dependent protein